MKATDADKQPDNIYHGCFSHFGALNVLRLVMTLFTLSTSVCKRSTAQFPVHGAGGGETETSTEITEVFNVKVKVNYSFQSVTFRAAHLFRRFFEK